MVKISPSILASDFLNLKNEIASLEKAGVDLIHFDIMDGGFVPNITFGFKFLSSIKKSTHIPADVHLMINEPGKYIDKFIDAGADMLTFHYEAAQSPAGLIKDIKKRGCKAGISLKPATPVSVLKDIISDIDLILLMSVEPGFCGQEFMESSFQKIIELKNIINTEKCNTLISVDGGVGLDNYKQLIDIGADILVMGSSFFGTKNHKQFVKTIKKHEKP